MKPYGYKGGGVNQYPGFAGAGTVATTRLCRHLGGRSHKAGAISRTKRRCRRHYKKSERSRVRQALLHWHEEYTHIGDHQQPDRILSECIKILKDSL